MRTMFVEVHPDGASRSVYTLSILDVVFHDQGTYQCQVRTDGDDGPSKLFFLYVTGEQ